MKRLFATRALFYESTAFIAAAIITVVRAAIDFPHSVFGPGRRADWLGLTIELSLLTILAFIMLYITNRVIKKLKHLEGLLPVCSYCKRMRTPNQSWVSFEQFISERSDATFSHGICPECSHEHFREFSGPLSRTAGGQDAQASESEISRSSLR